MIDLDAYRREMARMGPEAVPEASAMVRAIRHQLALATAIVPVSVAPIASPLAAAVLAWRHGG